MLKYKKQGFALICALSMLAAFSFAESDNDVTERNENAKQVAKTWFLSLIQGNTAVTTALSAVPFSFDEKEEVKSLTELKRMYDQIVKKKGKRDLKPTSISIESSSSEKVEVNIMIENEKVLIFAKPGEAFHITGFTD